ncbi:MAG: hypothetical protein VW405_04615, partial [Rhodospirillaceae bacterium]
MADAADAKKRLPSQENLLLDYVRRLEKHRQGRKVVILHLSALRPFNRRDQHIRAAASNFDNLVSDITGQIFVMKNADIYFIYKSEAHGTVETIVQRVKYLFDDDPLVAEEGLQNQPFASWYDANADYDAFLQLVQSMAQSEQERQTVVRARMDARAALKAKQKQGEPLTPDVLARVETALVRADLSNLVRQQFVCSIDSKMVPIQHFSELFISIADLRETLLPGVNLV